MINSKMNLKVGSIEGYVIWAAKITAKNSTKDHNEAIDCTGKIVKMVR